MEYIEASIGLSRAQYLIGIAGDAERPKAASSTYIDRRSVGEASEASARATAAEMRLRSLSVSGTTRGIA
jgi:hypothetical protein